MIAGKPTKLTPKVAIVDDDPLMQECWRLELRGEFQVMVSDSPDAFLQKADLFGDLCCVIVDYQFKGAQGAVTNGVQLAQKIKEKDQTLPIILSSGFDVGDNAIFSAVFLKGNIPSAEELKKFIRMPSP